MCAAVRNASNPQPPALPDTEEPEGLNGGAEEGGEEECLTEEDKNVD